MKLYWCTTHHHEEDWFVVAPSAALAAIYHEDVEGYDRGEARAELVCAVPRSHWPQESSWPDDELLLACGAEIVCGDTPRVVRIGDRTYAEGMLEAEIRRLSERVGPLSPLDLPDYLREATPDPEELAPTWLAPVTDTLSAAMTATGAGPIRFELDADGGLLVWPAALLLQEGDGEPSEVYPFFFLDISAFTEVFERPPLMSWSTGPERPCLSFEGTVDGQEVFVRVLDGPLEGDEPALLIDASGEIKEIEPGDEGGGSGPH